MSRKSISDTVAHKILYESAYVCAICQKPNGQIHHIDGNNSNNVEENLIFLCIQHHAAAHTKSTMTRNLGVKELQHAKDQWLAEVQYKRTSQSTMSGQIESCGDCEFSKIGVTWGLINHSRVSQLSDQVSKSDRTNQLITLCSSRGIVDSSGIMIEPEEYVVRDSFVYNSIYDRYPHGDDQRLHQLYASMVDDISRAVAPIHLQADQWSVPNVQALISPGTFIYVQHRFYFKTTSQDQLNEHRRVHFTKNKVGIEFFTDSFDMFGTTSMTVSFVGGNSCAALLHVKSIDDNEEDGVLLRCTPIALGVGFNHA